MTDSNKNSELRQNITQIWHDSLGEHADATWHALSVEPVPFNLVSPQRTLSMSPMPAWVALAASLVIGIGLMFTILQQRSVINDLLLDKALLSLQSPQPWTQLQALTVLRERSLSIPELRWPELIAALQGAQDPNIQLATLEILIAIGAVRSAADLPDLDRSTPAQQQFLEAVYREQHL